MISLDSVVALTNGFVTVDKLNSLQYIKGEENDYWLKYVEHAMMKAVLLSTKAHDLICSYNQGVKSNGVFVPAIDLKEGDIIDTTYGQDILINRVELNYYDMVGLHMKSGHFLANGFILLRENGKN